MESSNDLYDYFEQLVKQSDLAWSLQFWESDPSFDLASRKKIHEEVLNSPSVRAVIKELSKSDEDAKDVLNQANLILEEMGHNFDMKSVRMLGFVLSKLLRRLFGGLIVNKAGINDLRSALQKCPVVLLPTHRSYVDFLLISYFCFAFNLPMPIIAAGADFKGMAVFGKLLQNAGAFFIRRSFGGDKLYWVIVTEYIQYHLKNRQAPVEFFIEGTRSRCGKSVPPKQGMLSMVLEPYMKLEIPDVALCPISITYDRLMEEFLYSKELLGIPKMKESTKGLFNAMKRISKEKYGRIYLNIGTVIYAHAVLPRRVLPCWKTEGNTFSYSETEKAVLQRISLLVSQNLQQNCVVPTFSMVAAALSTRNQVNLSTLELIIRDFLQIFDSLKIPYVSQKNIRQELDECLLVHKNKLDISHTDVVKFNPEFSETAEDYERKAVSRLLLQNYSNQVLAHLIGAALRIFVRNKLANCPSETLIRTYEHSGRILRNEFLLLESSSPADWERVESMASPAVKEILHSLVIPFVDSAYLLLSVILQGFTNANDIKEQYKASVLNGLGSVLQERYEMLAMDEIQRHLDNLVSLKILVKKKTGSAVRYEGDYYQLQKLADGLEPLIASEVVSFVRLCFSKSKITAKL